MKSLLDSNIIIDHLNQRHEARDWMESVSIRDLYLSWITYAEVLAGCHTPEEWQKAMLILDEIQCLTFDLSDFIHAAQLRHKFPNFKLPDALLASLAIKYNLILMTRNTKDFNPAIHKFVKVPYKLR